MNFNEDQLEQGKCRVCKHRTQITKDVEGVDETYVGWCVPCIEKDQDELFEDDQRD
jgi:hypothetical protein